MGICASVNQAANELHWMGGCRPTCGVQESFLDEGFILDKRIGVGQPKRIENAKILVANTAMDTDKIKIYGARVRVDSMAKVCSPPFFLVSLVAAYLLPYMLGF